MMIPTKPLIFFLFLTLLLFATDPAAAAPKTDTVIFKNGDQLTGEVKGLSRGRLNLNTDATGTIGIEWDKVAQVISTQSVQVETDTGTRFFGQLVAPAENERVVVSTNEGPKEINARRVVLMTPIETTAIQALDIDVSIGYNFTKAGGVKQGTIGLDMDYRTRLRSYSLSASTVVSDSNEIDASKRSNLALEYKRLWRDRWFVNGNVNLDQNDELGLNLRTSAGGGGGRYLLQNNNMLLTLQGGLLASRENNVGEVDYRDSIEAMFSLAWDWFRFDSPELDWSTTATVIPNLTDWGRVRAEFDTSLKWELIHDLNWGVSFYGSFDNKPQSETASTSDYGVNTTFTYEF